MISTRFVRNVAVLESWSDEKQRRLTDDNPLTINWPYYPSINRDPDRWQITTYGVPFDKYLSVNSPCFDFGRLYRNYHRS